MVKLAKAYTEIYEILKYIPSKEREKVSLNLLETIEKNMDREYKFKVNNISDLKKQELLPETITLLAIMYREYWATSEEKASIIEKELREIEVYNKKIAEKNDLSFALNKVEKADESIDARLITDMTVVNEKKWFSKFLFKLKHMFKN